jgi:deoxycytidylate deaminase
MSEQSDEGLEGEVADSATKAEAGLASENERSNATPPPELVVAIVSAIGTSVDPVVEALQAAFQSVNYHVGLVRVSDLLAERKRAECGETRPTGKKSKARWLMDLGDELRETTDLASAACSLAVTRMRHERRLATGNPDVQRINHVTIIRSVKLPEEIDMLRTVYGARLLVLGVSSPEENRKDALLARLRHDHPERKVPWYHAEATRLIERDQKDSLKDLGQQVRKAFSRSDAFVWLRPGRHVGDTVGRLVNVWFGEPFTTPTRDEQAMFLASAAQFRSAAAGRQVGVAIIDAHGEALVLGTNDVPKPGGGQYWPGDEPDHRDFSLQFEMNDREKYRVATDVISRLKKAKWLKRKLRSEDVGSLTERALGDDGPLADSRVEDLIEFGRIMHAEMAAICTAARRGTAIRGGELYTTTYPCHECARLIIGSGIARVVYVDPYPKSRVSLLYRDQVSDEEVDDERIPFVPFEGVAPVLFASAFRMNQRSRAMDGTFAPWIPQALSIRIPDGAPPLTNEVGVLKEFEKRLNNTQNQSSVEAQK